MKRVLSLVLVLVTAAGLFAGGSKEAAKTAEKQKIALWHIRVDKSMGPVVAECVDRYMKDNPNVEVENVANENDPYKTKLKVAMGSGNSPDIFHSWGGGWLEAFVKEGMVGDITADLDKDGWRKTYFPSYLGMTNYGGKDYGVPAEMSSVFVFYNKEIFNKVGIQVPKTYGEFVENAKKLKSAGYIPIALGNKSKWPGALTFIYLSLRTGGYEVFENAYNRTGKHTFEDASFIDAGKKIQQLVDIGAYPEGMNGINYDTGGSRMLIYSEKAAMIIQTSGFIATAKAESPDFYEKKLGYFAFPAVEGGKGDPADILGGVNAYSVSGTTKAREASVKLLKYLSDKTYGQMMADRAGRISPVFGVEIKNPMLQGMFKIASAAKHTQAYYDQFLPPALGELHKDTTQAIFGKTMTPEEAAKQMEAKAKQVFGK